MSADGAGAFDTKRIRNSNTGFGLCTMKIPDNVEPMVILGNDNDYLTVYTYLTNAEALELLKRSIEVLEYEENLDSESSRQLH